MMGGKVYIFFIELMIKRLGLIGTVFLCRNLEIMNFDNDKEVRLIYFFF